MTDDSTDADDTGSNGAIGDNDDTGNRTDRTDSRADERDADADLERAVEDFLRDARGVYEEYEAGYLDPDAALWTLEGHIDGLEDAIRAPNDED
ncbi:hypothetical protein BRD01_11645 [Halobacteriales archaeon QS_8_65_32]|nr:MAG: hypothetical protein BRD01_11645 [Halobacteriales archaeon QS_8_65_32]